jgi:hypothetical protein
MGRKVAREGFWGWRGWRWGKIMMHVLLNNGGWVNF